jgi:hypothetical protein
MKKEYRRTRETRPVPLQRAEKETNLKERKITPAHALRKRAV